MLAQQTLPFSAVVLWLLWLLVAAGGPVTALIPLPLVPCALPPASASSGTINDPCSAFNPNAACTPAIGSTNSSQPYVCSLSPPQQDARNANASVPSAENQYYVPHPDRNGFYDFNSSIFMSCWSEQTNFGQDFGKPAPSPMCSTDDRRQQRPNAQTSSCPAGYTCVTLHSTVYNSVASDWKIFGPGAGICLRYLPVNATCAGPNEPSQAGTVQVDPGLVVTWGNLADGNPCQNPLSNACDAESRQCRALQRLTEEEAYGPSAAAAPKCRSLPTAIGTSWSTCPCGSRCFNNGTCVKEPQSERNFRSVEYSCSGPGRDDMCPLGSTCIRQYKNEYMCSSAFSVPANEGYYEEGSNRYLTFIIIIIVSCIVGVILLCGIGFYCGRRFPATKPRIRASLFAPAASSSSGALAATNRPMKVDDTVSLEGNKDHTYV
ncbi:hypothetical protein DFJ77DRAFT_472251 [Powellomyces hirtus]|nr:hypothetical protein DFJ77DRAFT_472251 [Powellomyces hirtus]